MKSGDTVNTIVHVVAKISLSLCSPAALIFSLWYTRMAMRLLIPLTRPNLMGGLLLTSEAPGYVILIEARVCS